MKALVTGVGGQLGYDVMREFLARGFESVGCDLDGVLADAAASLGDFRCVPVDITDSNAVHAVIEQERPEVVIHCAAWTNVDLAEEHPALVYAVNTEGTRNVAMACRATDCKMMYISTDYVFDGQGESPWKAEDDFFRPLNVYGKTKLQGEETVRELVKKHFIVRIAWVFGVHGKNFIKTMIGAGKKRDEVRVVCDQIGTPTYTADLAKLLADMIETEKYGVYHATNEGGYVSWYEYCCEFYRQYGLKTRVVPVTTAEYGLSKAARPMNSRLDKSRLVEAGFEPLPDWRDAVRRYLEEEKL